MVLIDVIDKIYESRLNEEFLSSEYLEGTIHSQFSSVSNINFPYTYFNRLVTALPPGFSGIPDSIVVSEKSFFLINRLPIGAKVIKDKECFYFPDILMTIKNLKALPETERLRLHSPNNRRFVADKNRINKFSAIVESILAEKGELNGAASIYQTENKINENLRLYCRALIENDPKKLLSIIYGCIGYGKGLTPSSDDAIVGITAVIFLVNDYIRGIQALEFNEELRKRVIREMEDRTTDVSIKYIICAMEGRFSEVLKELVYSIFLDYEASLDEKIKAVEAVGGTSGMDMLTGVRIACEEILKFL